MQYRAPLARVRGLGSAKAGTGHWWMQRITAVALLPLTFWMLIFLDLSLHAPYQEMAVWLAAPLNSVCVIAWIIAVFYHAALGIQVVLEDYVAPESWKIVCVWSVNLLLFLLGLDGVIAVFRIISG